MDKREGNIMGEKKALLVPADHGHNQYVLVTLPTQLPTFPHYFQPKQCSFFKIQLKCNPSKLLSMINQPAAFCFSAMLVWLLMHQLLSLMRKFSLKKNQGTTMCQEQF